MDGGLCSSSFSLVAANEASPVREIALSLVAAEENPQSCRRSFSHAVINLFPLSSPPTTLLVLTLSFRRDK